MKRLCFALIFAYGLLRHSDALALGSMHCLAYGRVAMQNAPEAKAFLSPDQQRQKLTNEVDASLIEAARKMTPAEIKAHDRDVAKLRALQLKNGTDVPAIAAEEGFAPIANLWSRSTRTLDRVPKDNRLFHDAEFQANVDGAVQRIEGGTRVEWVKRGGGKASTTLHDRFSLSLHEMMNRVEAFPADMKAMRLRIANLKNKAHALEAFIDSGTDMFDESLRTTLARFNGDAIENLPLIARNRLHAKQLLDESKALLKQEEEAYALRDREQALALRKLEISFDYYLSNTLNENPTYNLTAPYQSLMDRYASLRDNRTREGLALENFHDSLEPSVAAKMDITTQQLSVERSSRRLRPLMIVPKEVFEPLRNGMGKMSSVIGAADRFFMNAKIAGQDITALNGIATSDAQKGVIKSLKTTGLSGTLMYLSRIHGTRVLTEVGTKIGLPALTGAGGFTAWLKWGNDETVAREKDCYNQKNQADFEACREQLLNTLFPSDPNLIALEKAQKAEMDPNAPQNRNDYAQYLTRKRDELLQSQN